LTKKERFKLFLDYFSAKQPDAQTELEYTNPYELLVAVILSAQCTDKRVNMITPVFYRKYPDVKSLAEADPVDVLEIIGSCSYPNNKTKHLIGMAQTLLEKFDGIVPDDVERLQQLPGVGRKTANVIASVVYKKPAMAVDTHVFRVAERIGLTTRARNPYQSEMQLIKYIPEELIPLAHHWLILHGRYVCQARKPKCEECDLKGFCRYYSRKVKRDSRKARS
jgi:endonuclease-3